MRKGIALPIEMIVVVAIAVLVLVVVAAFFVSGASKINQAELERAFSSLCGAQLSNCAAEPSTFTTSNFDVDGNGAKESRALFATDNPAGSESICFFKGFTTNIACRKACGCPT